MTDTKAIVKSPGQKWLDEKVMSDDRRDRMRAACEGSGITVEKLEAILARAVIDNRDLMKCDPNSLFTAMMTAAELGLSPSGHHNGAYFATYAGQCKLGLGYGAMIQLATRDGRIRSFKTDAVYTGDKFTVHAGTDNRIEHTPDYAARKGEPHLFYAVAFFADGGCEFEVMTRAEVDKVRQGSRNKEAPPWKYQFNEMAKKTVLRRLMKRLPLQPVLGEALEDADLVDGFDKSPGRRRVQNESDLASEVLGEPPGRDAGYDGPTDEDLAGQPPFDPEELNMETPY
jgi:recombination protein RecT